jgi:hypothetical protein
VPPSRWPRGEQDYADYCTPAIFWLKPAAGSRQIGVRSRRLHSACSLGQGTAAIGPVAAGRVAQSPLACILARGCLHPEHSGSDDQSTLLSVAVLMALILLACEAHAMGSKPDRSET